MAVCAQRGDAMCIVDPPFGLNVDEVIDWHNGVGYGHAAFNSSFGALYWPWIKVLDPYNRKKVWLPPSGFVLGQIAYTDNVTQPWFAPAGLNRGHIIQALEIEYSPTLGERDFLYGNGNAVNPIVNFTRLGIHIWGNRTLQRKPTALDRVNVRRMVLYAEKVISTSIKFLVFEPNDEITWKRFIDLVDPTMEFIRATRGLYDFRVICDESTNPPSQIDQNTMLGKVLVKPTKSAEVIIVDFTLLSTGAEFST
jgi:uncharacterized protein